MSRIRYTIAASLLALLLSAAVSAESGDASCLDCHTSSADEPVHAVFNTVHATIAGGGNELCIACHGASDEHRAAPTESAPGVSFGPRWQSGAEEQNGACLACHEKGEQMLWLGSVHQQEELTCAGCHDAHQQQDRALAEDTATEQCLSCHPRTLAEIHLPSRHPVLEGKTACSDCHNPHGSMSDGALRQLSLNENCLSCHEEKRGPFLWEHQPVTEDCSLCHRPHGSVNARLLTSRGPALCQQCHVAAFHPSVPFGADGLPGAAPNENLLGKNCLNCHSQVHGSNHPSGARLLR